ncbi:MAG: peptidyl-prolyl cis-trans isomerase [Candidatus Acidiferrales bacterium]
MLRSIQQRDLDRNRWIKITMAVILTLICVSMVVTLVPGLMTGSMGGSNPDTVATVGGQDISITEVQQQVNMVAQQQGIPEMMKHLEVRPVLDEMVFERALAIEAQRLGITVTPAEETEGIKEYMPDAWVGGVWQKDIYTSEIASRGMTVQEFEQQVVNSMLVEKFQHIVTDGISVTPAAVAQEFRWKNEKVKIDYVLISAADLAPSINPTDAELGAYFAQNSANYQVPEKRSARYALLDLAALRANAHISDDELQAYYNQNIDQFKVENRVHVEHILLKTIGKTDAEIAEIRLKAEDVLKQAKRPGANFEDLAKKYSEDDTSKPKGGDLGWIVEGQTVPEFQQAAFSLPKGAISDLVKTVYGFDIIKVLDRETAHTKSLDEVRDSILPNLVNQKVNQEVDDLSAQMASAVRQSDRQSLDDLARKFNLTIGETQSVAVTDPLGPLGNSADLHQVLFELNPGELSDPLQVDSGWVILTAKDVIPAHQGTLAEVHDRVLADYRQVNSVELARTKAQDLAKRIQAGEALDKAAKELGLAMKTSDPFARDGSIPGVGPVQPFAADVFAMAVGQTSAPTQAGGNWLIYRVADHQAPNMDDFVKESHSIEQQLVEAKQDAAFTAFQTALKDRMKKEGKITINEDVLNRLLQST